MIHLIVGKKGKGKTKVLLDRVNSQVRNATGSIVYLDMSSKHMYELNNRIRLIDISNYPVSSSKELLGFICGIISQDHDIQEMYLDGLLKLPEVHEEDVTDTIKALDEISTRFDIDLTLSVSMDKTELDDSLQDKILTAL